jgi:hypothetical protein
MPLPSPARQLQLQLAHSETKAETNASFFHDCCLLAFTVHSPEHWSTECCADSVKLAALHVGSAWHCNEDINNKSFTALW